MKQSAAVFAVIAMAMAIAVALLAQQQDGSTHIDGLTFLGEPVTVDEIALGQELYAANCASCHGADLEGQPDWKRRLENGRMPAPPHDGTGHTWHHGDQQLFTITKLGITEVVPGYQSDMPVFDDVLTDDQIRAVLAFIKSTWPERQRAFQADVTLGGEDGS